MAALKTTLKSRAESLRSMWSLGKARFLAYQESPGGPYRVKYFGANKHARYRACDDCGWRWWSNFDNASTKNMPESATPHDGSMILIARVTKRPAGSNRKVAPAAAPHKDFHQRHASEVARISFDTDRDLKNLNRIGKGRIFAYQPGKGSQLEDNIMIHWFGDREVPNEETNPQCASCSMIFWREAHGVDWNALPDVLVSQDDKKIFIGDLQITDRGIVT